jgi:hypothetical protein
MRGFRGCDGCEEITMTPRTVIPYAPKEKMTVTEPDMLDGERHS